MGFFGKLVKGVGDFVGSATGVGTLVDAGVGILGNIMGKKSQDSANTANLKIAQMNNEFNERMMNKQMAYNSASAQARRYKDAGLNATLMMQGQGAGSVQGATSSGNPTMQAFRPDMSSVGGAIAAGLQRYKENKLLDKQIDQIGIENQYRSKKLVEEIANLKEKRLSLEAKRKLDNITVQNLDKMQTAEYERTLAQRDEYRQTIRNLVAQETLLNNDIKKYDERFDLEKAQSTAHTLLLCAQRGLTKQQTRREVYNTLISQYDSQYAKQNANNFRKMSDAIVDTAYYQMEDAYNKANHGGYIYGPNNMFNSAYGVGWRVDNGKLKRQ